MTAMETLYGLEGIRCTHRHFDSVEQLKGHCPVIAQVKYQHMVDHYICVLDVYEDTVLVGDPVKGREILTHQAFAEKWRGVGIVVQQIFQETTAPEKQVR
jgi:predicted double-glycine peptidase